MGEPSSKTKNKTRKKRYLEETSSSLSSPISSPEPSSKRHKTSRRSRKGSCRREKEKRKERKKCGSRGTWRDSKRKVLDSNSEFGSSDHGEHFQNDPVDVRKAMDEKIDLKEEQEKFKLELKALREAAQWRRLQGISMEGDDILLAEMDVKVEPRRDEWMTTLPPERKPGVTSQSTTSFSRNSKRGRGDASVWTDTPSERAQKAKMNYLEACNEAAALAANDLEKKTTTNADAELVDKYNKAKRSKSLV